MKNESASLIRMLTCSNEQSYFISLNIVARTRHQFCFFLVIFFIEVFNNNSRLVESKGQRLIMCYDLCKRVTVVPEQQPASLF